RTHLRWAIANVRSSLPTRRLPPPAGIPFGGLPLGWPAPAIVNRWWYARSVRRNKCRGRYGLPNRSTTCECEPQDEERGQQVPAAVRNRGVSAGVLAYRNRSGSTLRA